MISSANRSTLPAADGGISRASKHLCELPEELLKAVIFTLNLREASMSGQQFTRANNRPVPPYKKLDSVFMDTKWELKFQMVTICALECIETLSDRAPIILDS